MSDVSQLGHTKNLGTVFCYIEIKGRNIINFRMLLCQLSVTKSGVLQCRA